MTNCIALNIENYINLLAYELLADEKRNLLQAELLKLTQFHVQYCGVYAKLFQNSSTNIHSLEAIPPLSVRLFKELELKSIKDQDVAKTLNSSGTTGKPSRIFLSAENAKLQSQILVKILQSWLGKSRRPMLLIDSPNTVKSGSAMTARAAGLQGLSFFGRDHTYALDDNMRLNIPAIESFFAKYSQQPVLMFGFTFMVWQCFIQQLRQHNISYDFADVMLIHGGGWKKLQHQAVSNSAFKQSIKQQLGNVSVHDYYGMVEQTGTIYMECEQGHLHCPVWSDVLIRNPADMSLCEHNQVGLIQVNSVLAQSYPGHCLLTEDLGEILGEDDCACGRNGKYFKVHGRVPKSEVRGCSDTFS